MGIVAQRPPRRQPRRRKKSEFFSAQSLDKPRPGCYNIQAASSEANPWGCSSPGRALEWHSRGKGFDPPHLHQDDPKQNASGRSFLLETAHSSAKNPVKTRGVLCSYGIYMESTRIVSAPVGLLASKMHTFRVLLSKRRPSKQKIFKSIYMRNSQMLKSGSAKYCLLTVCWFCIQDTA